MPEEKKPIPPRPPAPELKPIIAGRLWIGLGVLITVGLIANPVFNNWVAKRWAPPAELRTDFSKWKMGGEASLRVTVITADAARLACAHSEVIDGAHCAFGKDKLPWARAETDPSEDNGENIIQPYRTSPDNALVLVIGLWAQPEVAMRRHREPPIGVPAKRLNRFDVTCQVKFVGKLDTLDMRWDVTGAWQAERNAWVVRPIHCQVNNS